MTSLTAPLPTREQAITSAGQVLAAARAERDQLFATGGAEAVADAAWRPGGPSKEQIARTYEGWVSEERAKQAAAWREAKRLHEHGT
jgi:hypothetical protein